MILSKSLLLAGLFGNFAGILLDAGSLALLAVSGICLREHVRALERMARVCSAAASGDLEARVREAFDPGLLGQLQRSINRVLDISDAFVREASGSMRAVSRGRYHRKVLLRGLPGFYGNAAMTLNAATDATEKRVGSFARFATVNVGTVMGNVAAAAAEMRTSAESMSASASQSVAASSTVAAAAEQAAVNVQSVAASVEELANSIAEISRQVDSAACGTRFATDKVEQSNRIAESLNAAAGRIGKSVQLIAAIAKQTNLLALLSLIHI